VKIFPDSISYKKENRVGFFLEKLTQKSRNFFLKKTNAEKFFFRKDL